MTGFLIVNPRAGDEQPTAGELVAAAERRGIETHALEEGEDAADAARAAGSGALGMAGGDGSLGDVAAVALKRGAPFVCVPFGTRNHFACDLGLDPGDPIAALDAFGGSEHRVDIGRAGDVVFLNNISLGLYALLVHERERRRLGRHALAMARALSLTLRNRHPAPLLIDGTPTDARIVLVANNAYRLDFFSPGARERLDEGRLHLYESTGLWPKRWGERAAERFVVDSEPETLHAAVDGDPIELETPLELAIAPRALRVLLPGMPG